MTDDDFDKVDEDFASEFDFVDTHEGSSASGTGPQAGQPIGNSAPPPKGSPAIVSLLVLITVLGGGYFMYTHFFAKSPTAITPPAPSKPKIDNELPTMPEHGVATPATEPTPTAAAAHNGQSTQEAANAVADTLNTKPNHELSTALPPPSPSTDKTFEQMQKEVHSSQPVQQQQATVPAEVRTALQNISEEMTANANNIQQLEGTMSNVAITLDHLNKTISAMDNRVLSLTETVDGLSQDLANVKRVMVDQDLDLTLPGNIKMNGSSSKKQLQTISSSEPNYSVHAIIPGRAWLKSASGQIITVTEGDKIGDYGSVAVIDAANGLVRTSSGIIIR